MLYKLCGAVTMRGVLYLTPGKKDGGPGCVVFDDKIDETGDYRIGVAESSMADAWRGNFTVIIDIVSEGSNAEPGNDNQRLAKYVGRYPSDLFRGVPSLKTRLRKLLGTRFHFFFNPIQTQMPIAYHVPVFIVHERIAA